MIKLDKYENTSPANIHRFRKNLILVNFMHAHFHEKFDFLINSDIYKFSFDIRKERSIVLSYLFQNLYGVLIVCQNRNNFENIHPLILQQT